MQVGSGVQPTGGPGQESCRNEGGGPRRAVIHRRGSKPSRGDCFTCNHSIEDGAQPWVLATIHNLCATPVEKRCGALFHVKQADVCALCTGLSTGTTALRRRVSRETGLPVDNSCG
jgi:hypothetical protein